MDLAITCGQLLLCGFSAGGPPEELSGLVARGERGGVILFKRNIGPVEEVAAITAALATKAPAELPLLVSVDQEGGRVARLGSPVIAVPAAMKLGNALSEGDLSEEEIAEIAALQSAELRALGFTMNYAPVLDIHSRAENPVIGDRSFGTNSEQASRGALAFARGMARGGILACGKHFPGHGDTTKDSHLELPEVAHDRARLEAVELAPFRRAAAALPALMTAHVRYPALDERPATLARSIATELLRDVLGFRGVLISDDLEMKAVADRWGPGEAAVLAVEAGCDALLVCSDPKAQHEAHAALVARAERDAAFRARCEEACARVVAMKRSCAPHADLAAFRALVASPEAERVARRLEVLR
jgi:beta-N-acetylhexosaminidase